MEPDPKRMIEKWMVEKGLEKAKSLVESGEVSSQEALAALFEATADHEKRYTPEYKKFGENSGLIFKDEVFFPASYPYGEGLDYTFVPASQNHVNLLFKLYQHLSGADYQSPEQLREIMQEAVKNKRILELGSGPGFALKVLQDLGANVSGVEIRKELIKIPGLDVRHGDAEELDKIFKDEEFDLVYSRDLFCKVVMDREKSRRIGACAYKHTRENGLGTHHVAYIQLHPVVYEFKFWSYYRQQGKDHKEREEWWDSLSDLERSDSRYTNECTLDPQYLLRDGFRILEYSLANEELSIVVRK